MWRIACPTSAAFIEFEETAIPFAECFCLSEFHKRNRCWAVLEFEKDLMRIKKFAPCLLMLVLLCGCAGQNTLEHSSQFSDSEKLQRYEREDQQLAEQNAARIQAAFQKELEQLRSENAALKGTAVTNRMENEHLKGLLQLNDAIVERKGEFIQEFQEDFGQRRNVLFEAMQGNGNVKEFEVEDVFVYKDRLGVTVLFLWTNADLSGGLGRGLVVLDPEKNYEISDCEMLGQRRISPQELAALDSNNEPQLQQEASQIQKRPDPNALTITNETKNHLIEKTADLGLGLLGLWIGKQLMDSDQ
jgi:hypothetical protein